MANLNPLALDPYPVTLALSKKYTDSVALSGVAVQYPKIDGATQHWLVFDSITGAYVDSGITARGQSPRVSAADTWEIWDDVAGAYVDTGKAVTGPKGDTGATGATGATGPAGADGVDGTDGVDGATPHIDPVTKNWFIGTSDTGVRAEGVSPHVDTVTGNWFVGTTDTGIHAQGPAGAKGEKGDPGTAGPPSELDFSPGAWNDTTAYVAKQVVVYQNSIDNRINSYVALKDVPANTPPTALYGADEYWSIYVSQGPAGAQGEAGADGEDGVTPSIDGTTKHWMLGATDTGVVAEGKDGVDGNTPEIDSVSGNWVIGGVDTGVHAKGDKGDAGYTPNIGDNGNWFIGTTDTGVKAAGTDGTNGIDGADGEAGVTPHIDPTTGRWFIGTTDTNIQAEASAIETDLYVFDATSGNWEHDGEDSGIAGGQTLPPLKYGAVGFLWVKVTTESNVYFDAHYTSETVDGVTTVTLGTLVVAGNEVEIKYLTIGHGILAEYALKSELTALDADYKAADTAINAKYDALIPTQATSTNQLADKAFVNSSIQNMAANRVTYNAAGDPFPTRAELLGATTVYSNGVVYTPSNHDYAYVNADEGAPSPFTGGVTKWEHSETQWEYVVGVQNRPFTAAELAALESGITAELVTKLSTPDTTPTSGSVNLVTSGGVFAADAQRQAIITANPGTAPMLISQAAGAAAGAVGKLDYNAEFPRLTPSDKVIAPGTDMNGITKPGSYISGSGANINADVASLVNSPISALGLLVTPFILYVIGTSGSAAQMTQLAIAGQGQWIAMRKSTSVTAGSEVWSPWLMITGSAAPSVEYANPVATANTIASGQDLNSVSKCGQYMVNSGALNSPTTTNSRLDVYATRGTDYLVGVLTTSNGDVYTSAKSGSPTAAWAAWRLITLLDKTTQKIPEIYLPSSGYSGENLLDNPDFRAGQVINQPGQTFYDAATSIRGGLTIDRWVFAPFNKGRMDLVAEGAKITAADVTTNLYQGFELKAFITSDYTLTVSINNIEYVGHGKLTALTNSTYVFFTMETALPAGIQAGFGVNSLGLHYVQLSFAAGSVNTINYIKLERGGVATPYVRPNIAVENVKCQRYLIKMPECVRWWRDSEIAIEGAYPHSRLGVFKCFQYSANATLLDTITVMPERNFSTGVYHGDITGTVNLATGAINSATLGRMATTSKWALTGDISLGVGGAMTAGGARPHIHVSGVNAPPGMPTTSYGILTFSTIGDGLLANVQTLISTEIT